MRSHAAELFHQATASNTALVAFNVISLEQAEAIVWAAEDASLPVIAQLSENAIRYHREPGAIAAAMVSLAEQSSTPVMLHLDHITQLELAQRCEDLGFSSLMWDSSHADYADNVRQTANIVSWAHERGIWVESEIGEIGGKDGAHAPGVLTRADEAARFVGDTGVDALAVAVGSSHAMVDQSASLNMERISEIAASCEVPLVLHGSSGVPDQDLREAVARGMRKINIGTALSREFSAALRASLANDPDQVDPRRYLAPARRSTQEIVSHYLHLLSRRDEAAD